MMALSNKNKYIGIFFVSLGILMSVLPANADIYMYIDKGGVMHFTNVPTSSRYKLFVKGRPSRSSGSYSSTKYDHFIDKASRKHGISFPLVKAVIKVESNFNPRAVSRAGAQGLMQIMPGTADLLNVSDPFDPWENIMGGTRYLRMLMDRFDGKLSFVLAGYNAGPERVVRHKGIPPIRETQNYVKKVKKYYRMFKEEP